MSIEKDESYENVQLIARVTILESLKLVLDSITKTVNKNLKDVSAKVALLKGFDDSTLNLINEVAEQSAAERNWERHEPRSTVKNPCAFTHQLAAKLYEQGVPRADIVRAARRAGVNKGTAQRQVGEWFKKNGINKNKNVVVKQPEEETNKELINQTLNEL